MSSNSTPSATVVIPTLGRPRSLKNSVNSAIKAGQIAGNVEIVVVNDGTDMSLLNVIDVSWPPNVRVLMNSHQKGPSGARNCGVENATAPIIFFLDDDDKFVCGYIRDTLRLLSELEDKPSFGFSSVVSRRKSPKRPRESGAIGKNSPVLDYIAPLSSGVWIRRELFLSSGCLDTKLRINEDTEFFLRLASLKVNGWYSADPGVIIRPLDLEMFDETASITKTVSPKERAEAFEYILSIHSSIIDTDLNLRRKFSSRIVKYLARSVSMRDAISAGRRHKLGVPRILFELSIGCITRKGKITSQPQKV